MNPDSLPSEMVLVPREPTQAMMVAVDDAYGDGGDFPDMWEAAIAAAPTRPTASDFEAWLRTVCFQKPTPEAYDLAKCAWRDSQLAAHPAAPQGAQPAAPVAWLCEWAEWSQYHDASDPLPETWDSAAPLKITPLYASPADAAPVPQEVRMLTVNEILQAMVDELQAGVKHTPQEIIQRKFCEVNGLTIPAKEQP